MGSIASFFLRVRDDRRGVTAMEYALIAGFVAIAIVASVTTLGTNIAQVFTNVGNHITAAGAAGG